MKNEASRKIKQLHTEASEIASAEVIRIARKILRANADLKEFIMGMGVWSFSSHDGTHNILDNDEERLNELSDFIDEWDSEIHITGEPMRFTAFGKIIRNW